MPYKIGSFKGHLSAMSDKDKAEAMADVLADLYQNVVHPEVLAAGGGVLSQAQVCERVLKVLDHPKNRWPELTEQFNAMCADAPANYKREFAEHVFAKSWYSITA